MRNPSHKKKERGSLERHSVFKCTSSFSHVFAVAKKDQIASLAC